MTHNKSMRRRISSALATMTAALVVLTGLTLAPSAANATEREIANATLTWGVKSTFRNYIYNIQPNVFKGRSTLLGTTTQPTAKGEFVWSGGTGVADDASASADISFGAGNGVHFQSHPMLVDGVEAWSLDLQFTNPRVVVTSANAGELHVDVVGHKFVDMTSVGEQYTSTDVSMADLVLAAPTVADGSVTWTSTSATLTEDGSKAFGGFYGEGDALDNVTVTAPVTAATPEDPEPETPAEKPLPFKDVTKSHEFYPAINWMYQNNYVAKADSFKATGSMTRGAMATVLMRMNEPDYVPAASLKLPYTDVKKTDTHYKGIAWMYENGYAAKADKYNASNAVTRGAMATFLYRMENGSKDKVTKTGTFTDVPASYTHAKGVEWMAAKGYVVSGGKNTTYRPTADMTRQAMSAMLYRIYR